MFNFTKGGIYMSDRSSVIFGNRISAAAVKKGEKSKKKYIKKFGDDSSENYAVKIVPNGCLEKPLGVYDIRVAEGGNEKPFDMEKGIIVGNIRMGFGHYRISIAMASAAHALGYTPYWMDLNSYKDTTCTKVISAQNDLYSMGSRLSQKSRLFNKLYWEPLNYEGFRQLTYNSSDQKNAELMTPVFRNIPKDMPLIGTHVWPAQAAIHAGMKYVVNAIPDDWPMALHFAEGSVHTIQTYHSYMGYRTLDGMKGKEVLKPMPQDSLRYVGHYVDHELVSNIDSDCAARLARKKDGEPMRFLLTIGGAGAQRELFAAIIRHLMPAVKDNRAALYINIGDYKNVWTELSKEIPELESTAVTHFGDWAETVRFSETAITGKVSGIHVFWHENIFEAVYCTNLLMRSADVLATKPSELVFYPIPKLFLRHIGGHERWGAIHSAQLGDGTLECEDTPHTLQMFDLFLGEDYIFEQMCSAIKINNSVGVYNGAYNTVKLAMELKKRGEHSEK